MTPHRDRARVIWQYSLLTYAALLINLWPLARGIEHDGWRTWVFAGAAYVTYALMYLLPLAGVLLLVERFLPFRASPRLRSGIVSTFAVVLYSLLQVLVYADRFIHGMYGFHLNGFVWNLVFTRGGFESLGGTASTQRSFALIIAGFVVMQAALLALVVCVRRIRALLEPLCRRHAIVAAGILVLSLALCERIAYGLCYLKSYTPVVSAADSVPLYMPVTFNSLAERWGYKRVRREQGLSVDMDSARLAYPLKPIERAPVEKPLNIVWLVCESLRYDMLDPKIMPNTWAFKDRAQRFVNHYSGGNGTRMGMFALFYGLYGNYWFPFLAEERGPVLMDALLDMNYQMKMFTSARFTYPEFDRTIFARVPGKLLHEGTSQPKWRRDADNVDLLLDFVGKRDPSRPFMTFMFFEGPHASYYFPEDAAIATPFAEDVDYASMDLGRNIQLIKNRYINSCHQLDRQWARIIQYLTDNQLLDSTILILTGDHGEEFMEKGRWGHNSEYNEEQTRPPMVLWVPGAPPREVTELTSHLDIPATIMPLLGVKNPPEEYCLGRNLLDEKIGRRYTIIADWDSLAFVALDYKATFPMKGYGMGRQKITTRDDAAVPDRSGFYAAHQQDVVQVMKELTRFTK